MKRTYLPNETFKAFRVLQQIIESFLGSIAWHETQIDYPLGTVSAKIYFYRASYGNKSIVSCIIYK